MTRKFGKNKMSNISHVCVCVCVSVDIDVKRPLLNVGWLIWGTLRFDNVWFFFSSWLSPNFKLRITFKLFIIQRCKTMITKRSCCLYWPSRIRVLSHKCEGNHGNYLLFWTLLIEWDEYIHQGMKTTTTTKKREKEERTWILFLFFHLNITTANEIEMFQCVLFKKSRLL